MANLPFDEYRDNIDNMENQIIETMGDADALAAICKALDYDTKKEIYEYIIRVYDLEPDDDE